MAYTQLPTRTTADANAAGDINQLQDNFDAVLGGAAPFDEVGSPGTPATDKRYLYFKSDGKLYKKDDAGVETEIGAGANVAITLRESLVAGTNQLSWISPIAGTIGTIYAKVGTAPTGADLNIDINKNATSIFTTDLTIAATATTGNVAPATSAVAVGDVFTLDIDQVGSTVAGGSDLWIYYTVT